MSPISRRTFSKSAIVASALFPTIGTRLISAQDEWSADALQVMAPAAPGGGWDTTARELQRVLQAEGIVSTVEVFNVPGAGGTIGLSELATRHKGDSHTMMVMGLVMIGGIGLNDAPVGLDQSTPLARLTGEWEVIVVPKDSPLQTMDDLATALKDDAAAVSWAGGSAGGTDHLLVGLVAQALKVDTGLINYVPFSGGGEALASLLGGETTAGVSGLGEFLPQIESGDLRALAVSGRSEGTDAMPAAEPTTIPTLRESGIDVELANWRGVVAPPDLDDSGKQSLLDTLQALHDSAEWKATLERFDWEDLFLLGDDFAANIDEETTRVNGILTDLGLISG